MNETTYPSHLSNRSECTKINDSLSSMLPTNCGVAQGSIHAPLLFIIYVNDIIKASSLLHFFLYADDTSVFSSLNDINTLVIMLNVELTDICT